MKPSLHLGPVVITRQPSPKSAVQPKGLVHQILAAKGEALVRVVKDAVEMLRNEADFLKAATSRGLERVSRTGHEGDAAEVVKTALDRGPEPQYVEPGLSSGDPNAPFQVTNGGNYDNSFARKYAASLTTRECLASGCRTTFTSGEKGRLLCNVHAQKAGRLTGRGR